MKSYAAKYLKGCYPSIWLTFDSRFVQSSALIAGTRRVSPLVQNKPEDVKKPIRYVSPIEQKKDSHDINKGIALRHGHERARDFVH